MSFMGPFVSFDPSPRRLGKRALSFTVPGVSFPRKALSLTAAVLKLMVVVRELSFVST
jgi:hypothetical protein